MIWLILIATVLLICVSGAVYLSFSIARFGFIEKLSGGKKWLARLISFAILAVGFLLVSLALSVVDAAILFVHLVAFFLLAEIVVKIVKRIRKTEISADIKGVVELTLTIAYFLLGYYQCVIVYIIKF